MNFKNTALFDCHVHVGQYEEIYYNPHKIIEVLVNAGVKGAFISSTTSCLAWENQKEKNLIIHHIIDEFTEIESAAVQYGFHAYPLCWIIPQRFFEGDSVEEMVMECHYSGFKIHPRAHEWDVEDKKIVSLMNDICGYAQKRKFPVIIHTGECDFEKPDKFFRWFCEFQDVSFILAHCRKTEVITDILLKYPNVYGDVSFCPPESFETIKASGLTKKLFFGTDFPTIDFLYGKKTNHLNSLKREYKLASKEWIGYYNSFGDIWNLIEGIQNQLP